MQFLRRILFYIVAAVYAVLCPLLILYALGYIYSPETQKGFVKTGAIYLSTNPQGGSVFVNGEEQAQKTPALIQELTSGDYSVRISLEGYRHWQAVIPVQKEEATVLDKILLLPEKWDIAPILGGPFEDLIPVQASGYFLLKAGNAGGRTTVYDYKADSAYPLFSGRDAAAIPDITEVNTVRGSSGILFRAETPSGKRIYRAGLTGNKAVVEDVTELLRGGPEGCKWDPDKPELVFFLSGAELIKADLKEGAVYPGFMKGVSGFGIESSHIYAIGENTIFRTDLSGEARSSILDDEEIFSSIFKPEKTYEVYPFGEDLLFFIGPDGELLSNKLPYRFVETGTLDIEYDRQEQRLLVLRRDAVGVLDLSFEQTGEVTFEKAPRMFWMCRDKKEMSQAFFAYGASHAVYRQGSEVHLAGVEAYGKNSGGFLLEVKPGSSVYYSEEEGKIYFIDREKGNLNSVTLVPEASLVPDPFEQGSGREKAAKAEER
ncbi:MAG: PEGA domain-containing protein [Candidatus Omnitrophica bacterium]|nr:PEGA domain-containing protein [Candidatus Omnitrophota bacterium]